MKRLFIPLFLALSCINLQGKRARTLPSIKPQSLSEIKIESVPLIEKTTLTMKEAVEIAYQNKPNLKAYQYAIEESRMQAKQALSGYFPTINLSGNWSQTRGQSSPSLNLDLTVQQLIYSFAGPIEQYKKAKKSKQIVGYQNQRDKKVIRYEVEKAFLECWKAQQQNKSIISLKQASESIYEKDAHANKLELIDKNDWLKSTADHAHNLSIVDNFYETVMISQKKLEFFMGQPIDLEISGVKEIDSKYVDKKFHKIKISLIWQEDHEDLISKPIDLYYDLAVKNRDELKISEKSIAIAKDDMKIARGSRLPTLNFSFATGTFKSFGDPTQEIVPVQTRRNYQTVSANISWPIFDGLTSYYKESEAHATKLKEILNKEQITQEVKFDVERAYFTYIQFQTQFKAKQFDLERASNELQLKKQQFNIGDISKVDLDVAQASWDNSYYSWLESKIDIELKKRDLLFSCGYPEKIL